METGGLSPRLYEQEEFKNLEINLEDDGEFNGRFSDFPDFNSFTV